MNHLYFAKVEREKIRIDEVAMRVSSEKGALDNSLSAYEQENTELQRQVQALQSTLAETEQQHAQR